MASQRPMAPLQALLCAMDAKSKSMKVGPLFPHSRNRWLLKDQWPIQYMMLLCSIHNKSKSMKVGLLLPQSGNSRQSRQEQIYVPMTSQRPVAPTGPDGSLFHGRR